MKSKYWVLTKTVEGKDWIFSRTFGTKTHQYLWNMAWAHEHYDMKSIGPEGRNWFGIVNETGIQQLKNLGYKIQPAYVAVYKEDE